jgi:hypothetical protein
MTTLDSGELEADDLIDGFVLYGDLERPKTKSSPEKKHILAAINYVVVKANTYYFIRNPTEYTGNDEWDVVEKDTFEGKVTEYARAQNSGRKALIRILDIQLFKYRETLKARSAFYLSEIVARVK